MKRSVFQRFLACCAAACATMTAAVAAGPDVTLSDVQSTSNYGVVGDIRAYAIGSHTCNIGNANLLWTNSGTPGLAMNAYRLHDGRLMQIGMSWVKTACCAAAQTNALCGSCNGAGGSVLGAGCLDVYSSGWNGGHSYLGPRSGVNAYTGVFSPLPGGGGNAIFRRLQVRQNDLLPASFPNSIYFIEGVYVATDEVPADALNNASYKRVTLDGSFNMVLQGQTSVGIPAIRAWRDHGLGVNIPDPGVSIAHVDVPGEGRFWYASKVRDLGNGSWRYEYAVFNLNSDRSAGGLRIPLASGVQATNVGFHAPFYHSGEPYDNVSWVNGCGASEVCWRTTQTFSQNPNANALRWGTMYNFWFDANTPPSTTGGLAILELFKPHTPDSVVLAVPVPSPAECYANCDGSTIPPVVNIDDFSCFINQFALGQTLPMAEQITHYSNCDGSTTAPVLNIDDFTCYINTFALGCP